MSEKLYDLGFVEEMSGGNQEFTRQLMILFIETVPESLDNINKYFQSNEREKLVSELHKLKSTINTVKVPSFSQKVEEFEKLCKKGGSADSMKEYVLEFNDVLPTVVDQMRTDLEEVEKENNGSL